MKKTISILCIIAITCVTCLSASAYSWSYYNANGKKIYEEDTEYAEVRNTIYKYLDKNTDLNKAAICGILGNIWAECCFDIDETYGSYHGLCQWGGERWTACKNYCAKNGYKYNSVTGQTSFLVYELKNSYPKTYKKLLEVSNDESGVYKAEDIFRRNYEGCGTQAKARRQAAAITFWKNINLSTDTPVTKATTTNKDNNEVVETVYRAITQALQKTLTN